MMEKRGFSAGQITLAFLGGAAAGAAAALLTAPQSGSETREQLGDYVRRGKKYVRRGKKRAERLPETAQEAMDSASTAALEAFESALSKANMHLTPHSH